MTTTRKRETGLDKLKRLNETLGRVRMPPIRVTVNQPDGVSGTSYGDVLISVRGNTPHEVAEKMHTLANVIALSSGMLDTAEVFVLGVRKP